MTNDPLIDGLMLLGGIVGVLLIFSWLVAIGDKLIYCTRASSRAELMSDHLRRMR